MRLRKEKEEREGVFELPPKTWTDVLGDVLFYGFAGVLWLLAIRGLIQ